VARGTYLHSSKGGIAYDGVVEGSETKIFACEWRELGERARRYVNEENSGDQIDRFLVVRGRAVSAEVA